MIGLLWCQLHGHAGNAIDEHLSRGKWKKTKTALVSKPHALVVAAVGDYIHGQDTHQALNDAKATLHKSKRVRRQARREIQRKNAFAICGCRGRVHAARRNLYTVDPSTKRADDKPLHEKRR